jgi:hypothetical protein
MISLRESADCQLQLYLLPLASRWVIRTDDSSPRKSSESLKRLASRALITVAAPQPAPDIEWVAKLGAVADSQSAPANPLYLRAPDAQPQHAARLPRQ